MGTESYSLGMAKLYWIGSSTTASTNLLYGSVKNFCSTYSFGNIVAAEIAPEITYLDHYVSVSGDRRRDKVVAISKSISIPFTFDEINATNINKFMYGAKNATNIIVMGAATTPVEGSAVLYFSTDIGKDFLYVMPRAALKAEGGLAFTIDDWITGKFSLEVLRDADYVASKTTKSAPYGFIDTTAAATAAGG